MWRSLAKCWTVLTQDSLYEQSDEELPPSESLSWADGCLLVYAITDRRSFNYVRRARQGLGELPAVLVGNKADMVHLRQVSTEEGNVPLTVSLVSNQIVILLLL